MQKIKSFSVKRVLLGSLVFVLLWLLLFVWWALIPNQNGILQGATDETTTQFSIVSKKKNLLCRVRDLQRESSVIHPKDTTEVTINNTEFAVRKCFFTQLNEHKRYRLEIVDGNGVIIESRNFGMLSTHKKNFSIAIVSCTSDLAHIPLIWKSLLSKKPDLLLMIGDNVYADLYKDYIELTHNHFWHRYVNTWRTLALFQSSELIPVLGSWDDHDYGVNNGNAENKDKEFTLFLYDTFFAQNYPNPKLKKGPGTSFSFHIGKTRLIFADGRYFRSPPEEAEGSFFTQDQVDWIIGELDRDINATNWIITGNQWYGSKHQEENFEHLFPHKFYSFLNLLNSRKVRYLLVSGDTHFSEIKKIFFEGKEIFEVTSSGMHSWPIGILFPDSRRINGTNLPNFTIGKIDSDLPGKVDFYVYGVFGNEFFTVSTELHP